MNARTARHLERVAAVAQIRQAELRDVIETVVDEYLGLIPRDQFERPERKTGARLVYGESRGALSFVSDPEGTDVVPQGYEPPPGYHGP
jgi:hypothetical protein